MRECACVRFRACGGEGCINFSFNFLLSVNRFTVNDRLSPRGLICQNDVLGSIFKV